MTALEDGNDDGDEDDDGSHFTDEHSEAKGHNAKSGILVCFLETSY